MWGDEERLVSAGRHQARGTWIGQDPWVRNVKRIALSAALQHRCYDRGSHGNPDHARRRPRGSESVREHASTRGARTPSPRQNSRHLAHGNARDHCAAAGSSHQSPKRAFPSRPTRTAAARYAQRGLCVPSPRVAAEPSWSASPRFSNPEQRHADQTRGSQSDAEPTNTRPSPARSWRSASARHYRREDEELQSDQALGAALGRPE